MNRTLRRIATLIALLAFATATMGAESCGDTTGSGDKDTGIDQAQDAPKEKKKPKPAKTRHFSGDGSTNIGTVKVPTESVLTWTSTADIPEGRLFVVQDEGFKINVSSQGPKGKSALQPGTYKNIDITAGGPWTMTIKPR